MDNLSIREIALLAALNDSQALKRQGYAGYFRDPASLRDLYADTFEPGAEPHRAYPGPLAARAEEIRERGILAFYIDTLQAYRQKGVRVLPIFDPRYPDRLPGIRDPPFVLYLVGRAESLAKPTVAVVGTRTISRTGAGRARETVDLLVRLGYTIVSGLALGTDACAHTAALDCGGETIAVLPGDVTVVVPGENRGLAGRIAGSGLLLGEITHLAGMHKGRFLERNRITSGLSEGVVVIETGKTGGSVRQAETAFRQGRPVYVLEPDGSDAKAVAGYQHLVSAGAIPVESPGDLAPHFGRLQHPVMRVTTLADFW
ncbi:MAG: DNA-protecting protein DprA, partial [Methanoculleus sp.]|nr:DNA-protecting protein DprA [Methanoculleus sp.]